MELEVLPVSALKGAVNAPPSKSYTHRAIILSGLGRGQTKITNPLMSEDPRATINAIKAAGAEVQEMDGYLLVRGNDGAVQAPKLVDVLNSGTTIRIMSSVFSLCDKKVTLTGDESIQKRPMGPLLEALAGAGVRTSSANGNPPVTVQGPIRGNTIKIRGDVSSQYISGLAIAAPLRQEDTTIEITTELKSRPYLDLTLEAMKDFGVKVVNDDYQSIGIEGGQFYSKKEYAVEGDYSGAAFILGAAALMDSRLKVRNLFESSRQGDKYFLDILKMMGAELIVDSTEVTVVGGRSLRGVDVDLSQTPDLLPMVAVVCALARGKSRLYNVEHARIKECDRISAMAQGLVKMGAKVEEMPDGLIIEGSPSLDGAEIESFGDHRIVMAFAVAGLRAAGNTKINQAESVAVSFPDFIEEMGRIGADLRTS